MEKIVIVIAKMVKINILPPTSYCPRIFPDSTDFRFPISDYWRPGKKPVDFLSLWKVQIRVSMF